MDESDENSVQAVNVSKALLANRELFQKLRAKKTRFPKIVQALGELAVESSQLERELQIALCHLLTEGHPEMNPDVVNANRTGETSLRQARRSGKKTVQRSHR
jgi:hypothetical protein